MDEPDNVSTGKQKEYPLSFQLSQNLLRSKYIEPREPVCMGQVRQMLPKALVWMFQTHQSAIRNPVESQPLYQELQFFEVLSSLKARHWNHIQNIGKL
jgi:hypothetical protein